MARYVLPKVSYDSKHFLRATGLVATSLTSGRVINGYYQYRSTNS